jgi:hypothetical protein
MEASYSFPYTDPKSFVALSPVLEGVGVSLTSALLLPFLTRLTARSPFTTSPFQGGMSQIFTLPHQVPSSSTLQNMMKLTEIQAVPIAGSILTVESRHSSYICAALGESPFLNPSTPLWTSIKSTSSPRYSSPVSRPTLRHCLSKPSHPSSFNQTSTTTQPVPHP